MAKSVRKGKFRPPELRNRCIAFDEIRTSELSSEDRIPCKFHFDPTMWVVSANTQFATVSEKTISWVHVFLGSAETLVKRGAISNHRSIASSLSNIIAKTYKNRFMCVEVIVCNMAVSFLDTIRGATTFSRLGSNSLV